MKIEQRVEGAILGAILGDCVANPYLFCKASALSERRADIGWCVHEMSDESQLLLVGLGSIEARGMRFDGLVHGYQTWVKGKPADLDHVMAAVFNTKSRLKPQTLWAMSDQFDFGSLNSSSLFVRQIPIVLTAWREEDEPRLMSLIARATRLTHTDERVIELCQLYALTLAMSLRGESRLHIWDAVQKRIKTSSTYATVLESYYRPPRLDGTDYSSNRVTFQRVLFDLWHSQNFVASIRSVIMSGGGTDMNAAAVGAVLGAFGGLGFLSRTWMNDLRDMYRDQIEEWVDQACRIAKRRRRVQYINPVHNNDSTVIHPASSATLPSIARASRRSEPKRASRENGDVCEGSAEA